MVSVAVGVNLGHDRAACLVVDGTIRVAIAEERLSRIKREVPLDPFGQRYASLPCRAVVYCLAAAKLQWSDVDLLVASTPYVLHEGSGRRRNLTAEDVEWQLPSSSVPIEIVSHHLGHAASAAALLPADGGAVLVVDGGGSAVVSDSQGGRTFERTSIFSWDGMTAPERRLSVVGERPQYDNSLGDFYMVITEYLGFAAGEEGKLMALASYGRDRSRHFDPLPEFEAAITVDSGGQHSVDKMFQYAADGSLPAALIDCWGPPRQSVDGAYGPLERGIAASAQYVLENAMVQLAEVAYKVCHEPRTLGLAGGVALNCVANGEIVRRGPFDHVVIQPAASDDGTALGNAVLGSLILDKSRKGLGSFSTAYLGRSYEGECGPVLAAAGETVHVATPPSLTKAIVDDLLNEKVVAIYRGGAEFGPRALGHRSILCDPRSPDTPDRLNREVKHRERFRPFAPMTTDAESGRMFSNGAGDPYMTLAGTVRHPEMIAGVTHVDQTARVQVVSVQQEPFLHCLLTEFAKRSGVAVLLNTSFNDQEPIVETPAEAMACFLRTGIDVLYLESERITKAGVDEHA